LFGTTGFVGAFFSRRSNLHGVYSCQELLNDFISLNYAALKLGHL
jgi:hypothetical protein